MNQAELRVVELETVLRNISIVITTSISKGNFSDTTASTISQMCIESLNVNQCKQ